MIINNNTSNLFDNPYGCWNTYLDSAKKDSQSKNNYGESFEPKKAGTNGKHIVFVLDCSSSMLDHKMQTISGFNEFLEAQRKEAITNNVITHISVLKFNGYSVTTYFNHEKIENVKNLTEKDYEPNGSTNLLDAMGTAIVYTNELLQQYKKKYRESVIIITMTDGQENTSHVYKNNDIKTMVNKAESKNWSFIFLGANIDAFAEGQNYGFRKENTLQYDTININNTIVNASNMTTRLHNSYSRGLSTDDAYSASAFTESERATSINEV